MFSRNYKLTHHIEMTTTKRPLVIFLTVAAFVLFLFCNTGLRSNKVQPPAYYANEPTPFGPPQNCSFCHNGVPSTDSTNFILQMGTDSSAMTNVVGGVSTYQPGQQYFLRVRGTVPSAVYGFELTALDSANTAGSVTNFAILNAANTALVAQKFVTHHDADSNNQWTFTWTAPSSYIGPVTFYYAANDGVAGDTVEGDHIFLVKKTIYGIAPNSIHNISDKVNSIALFPTIVNADMQLALNLKETIKIECSVLDLNGRLIQPLLKETAMAGAFNRTFNLSQLAAGVYLIKIQAGDAFEVRKFVKN